MIEILKRPYLINWSGNNIYYELYSAAAAADSSITFEVSIAFKRNNETDFSEVIILPFVPVNGTALFDIKDIIDAQLAFDMPNFADESKICYNQSGQFYIEFREVSAAAPDAAFISTESYQPRYAVKGGVHPYHYKGNNFWLTFYPVQQMFFTWRPQGQLVLPTEQTFLSFFYDGADADVLAQLKVTYKDATTETFTRTIPVDAYCMIMLQSNLYFDWDGGAGFDADNVYKWEVRIRNSADDETLVDWFTYEQDNRPDYEQTIIHYRNSIGGLDNCRVRGVVEKRMNYELVQAEHILPVDYFNETALPAQQSTISSSENVIHSGEIGFVSKQEQESLRDIFLYRELYMKKLGKWWPLLLLTDDFVLRKTTDMRWSVPLEWKVALTAINHFNLEEEDFGEGLNSNNVCRATLTLTVGIIVTDPVYLGLPGSVVVDDNPDADTITEWEWCKATEPNVWNRLDIMAIAYFDVVEFSDEFIFYRPVAANGAVGITRSYFYNNGVLIPPPTPNSSIVIPYTSTFEIRRNSVLIAAGSGDGTSTPITFDCDDGTDLTIEVKFGSVRPPVSTLVSSAITYTSSKTNILKVMTFTNVDASGGIDITIS